jgi:septal ring factor EnvC (AmiA/AmiB activator)
MADRFFSRYNLSDDHTLLSNALLLTESQQNNPLASNAAYQALRGTGKPTYPMAKTILNNSAYSTNALAFNTYLNELESGTPRNTSKEEQDPNQLIHYFANLHAQPGIYTHPSHHADGTAKKPRTELMFQAANPKSTTSTSIPLNDWLSPLMKDLATDEKNRSSIEADEIQKAADAQAAANKAAAEKVAAERAASTTRTPTTRKPATTSPTPRTPNPGNPPRNPNGGGG